MTIALGGETQDSQLQAALTIIDDSGTVLARSDHFGGTRDARVSFKVTAGRLYFVQVSAMADTTGSYLQQLSVRAEGTIPGRPEFLPTEFSQTPASRVEGSILTTSSGDVLVILGTDGDDTLTVSYSNESFQVSVEGFDSPLTFAGHFAGVAIFGFGGHDRLRETYSVGEGFSSVIYGGGGDDQIWANGQDQVWVYGGEGDDQIVTIGLSPSVVYGQSGQDSFWLDGLDLLGDGESCEQNSVHIVESFVSPTGNGLDAPSLRIDAQDLLDPRATDPYWIFNTFNYSDAFKNHPLFAGVPQFNDIAQGYTGDCYFLAALSALAMQDPRAITESIIALGDGTYGVRFFNTQGQARYYRVDGQLASSDGGFTPVYAKLTRNGQALWVALLEKAFAQFRSGQNSYDSIQGGWMEEGYRAILGTPAISLDTWMAPETLVETIASSLAEGQSVTAGTYFSTDGYIIGGHAYNVTHVEEQDGLWYVTVYNPWGVDGGNTYDSNTEDGLLTITLAAFVHDFDRVQISTAQG